MRDTPRKVLALPVLLVAVGAAYLLVLSGALPVPGGADVSLLALTGLATVGAALARATLPALCGAVATAGFAIGATMSGFAVTVAAALAVLGAIGFVASTLRLAGQRVRDANPT